MEWVETTGRSVQEAKEAALDELGVDEADAEFEVVAEAQTGLFGRLRSEARVRARVRPTAPRAKEERRDRRDRKRRSGSGSASSSESPASSESGGTSGSGGSGGGGSSGGGGRGGGGRRSASSSGASGSSGSASGGGRGAAKNSGGESPAPDASDGSDDEVDTPESESEGDTESAARRRNRRRRSGRASTGPSNRTVGDDDAMAAYDDDETKGPIVEVDLDRQAEVAVDFLKQLTAEFGLNATVTVARPEEDTVELQLAGPDLGILIGPKGATLIAVQNLTRTVVFNETGGNNGHINVDVGGYRQKRTEALVRFATQVAETVKSSGNRTALEPMTAVDRKVVHDTISNIDGVNTVSEGEEPRRRVVVLPG